MTDQERQKIATRQSVPRGDPPHRSGRPLMGPALSFVLLRAAEDTRFELVRGLPNTLSKRAP